jgi:membrane protein implicated in regulation of membrane protease activity
MQDIINILFFTGTIAGGLLILLLLISIIGGMDIGGDVDVDAGGDFDAHGDADISDGSLGILKTLLTFVSVGAFTARAFLMNTAWSWTIVIITSIVAGAIAVLLLTWFFRWLLRNQEEGNWHIWQAEGKVGSVYVPIPSEGKGRIMVQIDETNREIAARSKDGEAMSTHQKVLVLEAKEDYVIVVPYGKEVNQQNSQQILNKK